MIQYTIADKAKSVAWNLIRTHWRQVFDYLLARFNKKYNLDIEVTFGGDITKETDYDPRDWGLDASDVDNLPTIKIEKLYMIDQGRAYRTRNGCVPNGTMISQHNNMQIKPGYEDYLDWLNFFEKQKLWEESKGASIPQIVNSYVKRWNELHPDRKIASARLHYTSPLIKDLLKKGYQLAGGHNTFPEYQKDCDDKKVDFDKYPDQERRGGHCTTLLLGSVVKKAKQIEVWTKGQEIEHTARVLSDDMHIVNSYPTKKDDLNIYENKKLLEQSKNAVWYEWFYVIYEANPKINPTQKTAEELTSYENAEQKAIWNGTEPDRPATRKEVATMVWRGVQYAIQQSKK